MVNNYDKEKGLENVAVILISDFVCKASVKAFVVYVI